MTTYRIRRVYEPTTPADGTRILVDRLWPRGLSKAALSIALWVKDLAPSTALRQWFAHDPAKWTEFRRRYRAELADKAELLATLRASVNAGPVMLLYAARDERYNHAVVLREVLAKGAASHESVRTPRGAKQLRRPTTARSPPKAAPVRTSTTTGRSVRKRSKRASGSPGSSR